VPAPNGGTKKKKKNIGGRGKLWRSFGVNFSQIGDDKKVHF
jgi:hypothetical protein